MLGAGPRLPSTRPTDIIGTVQISGANIAHDLVRDAGRLLESVGDDLYEGVELFAEMGMGVDDIMATASDIPDNPDDRVRFRTRAKALDGDRRDELNELTRAALVKPVLGELPVVLILRDHATITVAWVRIPGREG
jgi:hypothetical protein